MTAAVFDLIALLMCVSLSGIGFVVTATVVALVVFLLCLFVLACVFGTFFCICVCYCSVFIAGCYCNWDCCC